MYKQASIICVLSITNENATKYFHPIEMYNSVPLCPCSLLNFLNVSVISRYINIAKITSDTTFKALATELVN